MKLGVSVTKTRVFVDTNIIRYYFEDVPSAIMVIKDILDARVEGYTSAIVEMELYSLSNADEEWFNDVNTILDLFAREKSPAGQLFQRGLTPPGFDKF